MEEIPMNLWIVVDGTKYQDHVTIFTSESEDVDERVVYIDDLENRKQAYGICGECKEPGTGWRCSDFLNEIKSHLQIYYFDIIQCYGITQDPNTREYMMVLYYCDDGNLRNYLNLADYYIGYGNKIYKLQQIARGLLNIHNAGKVHKDFHLGNILHDKGYPYISDLGMCQPANEQTAVKGIYGVLPYIAPEVLRGHQYTKAADIYSFGIIMNEFLSEEIPFNNIPHDEFLAIKICKGLRPKISEDIPKLLADLIIKCWDAEIKNRPTTKELYLILTKWDEEVFDEACDEKGEIYFQVKECDKIGEKKFKNRSNESKSKSIQTHPQAIYTSRLVNFKNLPKPVNSTFIQINSDVNYNIQSASTNPISECLDVQLSELELSEICQSDESN
ncbi:kinase-like domain-containing protein [Rhizophagus clarus]|uniref:Kinase-like domain-containing protein n=1 Tax=Rhizophagus clarus TaxID=94130 RepID=A0A8H3QQK5_9GLOM|nr:kinase-like domain-containing protein [Rhizophagus clarus]